MADVDGNPSEADIRRRFVGTAVAIIGVVVVVVPLRFFFVWSQGWISPHWISVTIAGAIGAGGACAAVWGIRLARRGFRGSSS